MQDIHKIEIDFITPVHIGSGEEIESFSYIVKNDYFFKIRLENFLFDLNDFDRSQFNQLVNKNDIIGLREFISQKCDVNKYAIYRAFPGDRFKEKYMENFKSLRNKLFLYPFIRTGSYMPYIPGSSLKGAIRTAILNYFIKKDFRDDKNLLDLAKNKEFHRILTGKNIEGIILGNDKDAKKDPFRGLLVSDSMMKNRDYIIIGQVINYKPGNTENLDNMFRHFQMFYEVSPSSLTKIKSMGDYKTEGELRLNTDLFLKNFLTKRITVDQIIESCNSFYLKIADYEFNKFYKNTGDKIYSDLYDTLNNLNNNEFILRIGRFVHIESMTLEGFEELKRRSNRNTGGKTRNLLGGKLPMGWIKIAVK